MSTALAVISMVAFVVLAHLAVWDIVKPEFFFRGCLAALTLLLIAGTLEARKL